MKHSWSAVPEHWESLGHPSAGTTIDLYLALKSHNDNALIDALHEVSSPRHPKYVRPTPVHARMNPPVALFCCRYGAHLSKEQVAGLVAPHPDTLQLVSSWLEDHGVPSSSVSTTLGGNWLKVIGVPVLQANDILGASYQLYLHGETNGTVIRTVSYSLPEVLHGHIQTVVPTTYFGSPRMEWKERRMRPSGVALARANVGSGEHVTVLPSRAATVVTPAYVRWLYNTMGYVPAAVDRNSLGIAGFRKQYPSPEDLLDFMEEYRSDVEDAKFTVEPVNDGEYDPNQPGVEANLNIQLTEAITYPTPNIFYSIGGIPDPDPESDTDPYIMWLEYMLQQSRIPQTITISYGGYEYDFPPAYAEELCDLFAQLGALGVSILFASGDWGVGEGGCLIRDSSGHVSVQFLPLFPASCTCA